jgi:hypothetical protein
MPDLQVTCQKCGHIFGVPPGKVLTTKCPVCQPAKKARPKAPRFRQGPTVRSLEIGRQGLSQNETTYAHWKVHAKDKADWMARLRPLVHLLGGTYEWSQWRIVRLYSGRHRLMDFGNLVGGFKPAADCLTELGVIVDDSPKYFKADYEQLPADRTATVLYLVEYKLISEIT